jgi:hypothetical protein
LDYNRFKYSLLVDLVESYLSSVDRANVFGAECTETLWWWPEPEGFFSSSKGAPPPPLISEKI